MSETPDVPDSFAAARRACQQGDREGMFAAFRELQDTSIDTLLAQLATAIDEQRYEDAQGLLSQLQTQYEERADTENRTIARTQVVRTATDTDLDEVQNLTEYLRMATSTKLRRSAVLSKMSAFARSEGAELDQSEARQTVETAKQQEADFKTETETVQSQVADRSLSPRIAVSSASVTQSALETGATTEVSATITNVGDEQAQNANVTISAPDGVSLARSSVTLGQVSADQTVTESFQITGDEAGVYTLTITVTTSNAGEDTETLTLDVTGQETGQSLVERFGGEDNELDGFDLVRAVNAVNQNEEIGGEPVTGFDIVKLVNRLDGS